ncbi:7022_t:CDS:2 [Entrophospora sp. SA101]|nr:7022_t:CDS:2 [Entrophospora sp. SA101]
MQALEHAVHFFSSQGTSKQSNSSKKSPRLFWKHKKQKNNPQLIFLFPL